MTFSHENFLIEYKKKKRHARRIVWLNILGLVLVFYLSLCFRTAAPGFIPAEATKNLFYHGRILFSQLTGSSYALDSDKIILSFPYYGETYERTWLSFFTLISGMALGLSGAVFQQIFRNPVASPATIGATAGVSLGNILMVLLFSYTAIEMVLYRYIVCLALCFAITFLILGLCRIYSFTSGKYTIIEMLMAGSILSRMITSFCSYVMYNLNGSALMAYQELNLGVYQVFTIKSILLFLGVCVFGIMILLAMRYRINAAAFDQMEMKAAGIHVEKERFVAQLLATALVGASCIQCGDVGIFTLVVPHILRYAIGSDFRKLAIYSTIWGGIFLLILRMISSMIFLGADPIPLNFIVSTVMLPIFFVMLVLQRRGFE